VSLVKLRIARTVLESGALSGINRKVRVHRKASG
jgi:hypothetical protein